MTFSQAVKEELLVIDIHEDVAKLELVAGFKAIGNLIQESNSLTIEVRTMQIKLAKRLIEIINHEYPNTITQTIIRSTNAFKKNQKEYVVKILTNVEEILLDLKLIDKHQNLILNFKKTDFRLYPPKALSFYAMIFFCASGSINDPRRSGQYHLEIRSTNEMYLKEILNMTTTYDINFKLTRRKNSSSLYLNKSEEIADFLKFIHATNTLLEFEDFRIIRDMKLMHNRLNNADIANETKKISTINKQIDAINYLKKNNIFKDLSEKQKIVANLRLEYPEDSLSELSKKSNNEISKSNISHHLRNIIKIYEAENKK